jgi:hypothetical protein
VFLFPEVFVVFMMILFVGANCQQALPDLLEIFGATEPCNRMCKSCLEKESGHQLKYTGFYSPKLASIGALLATFWLAVLLSKNTEINVMVNTYTYTFIYNHMYVCIYTQKSLYIQKYIYT